ncbi:aminoacyl-tRNA hydrolase [Rhodoferax sp.]|uniref:aminoacyl-tRNA hydrolase n=1 Tax=Rhodoferax sp. TaxID=50421 RepID=UPI00271AF361|nr:aminoacyl-tRNA hydrolase [Rhodoferax sp.]MDO9195023.1 aminoacyl-tRNA hydrolase [Rhodoferax sp.]
MHLTPGKILNRLSGALGWRLRKVVGDDFVDRTKLAVAPHWRPFLKKPVFVGVTGSVGKTTTKELLVGVLSRTGRGVGTVGSFNNIDATAQALLRLRPRDNFFVAELSEDKPGVMDGQLALLQPGVGVVTVVGYDHWSAYDSREAIAAEMGKLIASLPATGTAVLNADDALVLAMGKGCAAKVLSYGLSPQADLRAEEIRSAWPDRLEFTLVHHAARVKIRTQLCGTHWIPSVLGAMGGALASGLTLAECAEGIAQVPPFEGRMQPVTTPEGVTFIRDDYKAPLWTVDTCLAFMSAAQARRKIIVIGSLSDCGAGAPEKYAKVAKRAQEIADLTIFVGPWASQVLKARKPDAEHALLVFRNVRDAAEHVNSITREGDLVLLKGTNKQDHLLRIILTRSDPVACWRDDCERMLFCHECIYRTRPSGLPVLMGEALSPRTAPEAAASEVPLIEPNEHVVVGLGNPEARYAGTPHNVGFEVVEGIATAANLTWRPTPEGWIARGAAQGHPLCLVKINMPMNLIGAGLKRLSERITFGPDQCILVFDDLDMPLGAVRTRMSGGAGGHRGVTSILEAFQTDTFRRVKVGVGQDGAKLDRVAYVLTPFADASRPAVDQVTSLAGTQVLDLVKRPRQAK